MGLGLGLAATKRKQQRERRFQLRGHRYVGEAVVACLLLSAVLLGGVHFHVALAICAVTCATYWLTFRGEPSAWNHVASVCALLAVWTLLSVVPLPSEIVHHISPETAEIWSRALEPFDESAPRWVCLSLDPVASLLEVAKWCFYAVGAAAAGVAARSRGLHFVMMAVWGTAVVISLITIFQAVSGTTTVLGLYEPQNPNENVLTSVLINPNNLAGYMNLGVFCGVGLSMSRRTRLPVPLVVSGTVLCLVITVLSGSRGGLISLVLGVVGLSARWVTQKRYRDGRDRMVSRILGVAPLFTVLVVGFSVVGLVSTNALWGELLNDDIAKLGQVPRLLPALSRNWLFGIGRGAFETVSFLHFGEQGHVVHQHIENFVMSWFMGWGVPAAVLALASFGLLFRPSRMGLRNRRTAQAAFLGVLVVAAQNLLDLGLEVLSLTLAVACIFGALEGSREDRCAPAEVGSGRVSRILAASAPFLGFGAALCAAFFGPDVASLRLALTEVVVTEEESPDRGYRKLEPRLRAAMRWRPAEPYFPLLGAEQAVRAGRDALPWAVAALRRAPRSGRVHLALAEALRQRGAKSQTLLHYRMAMEAEPRLLDRVSERVVQLTTSPELLEKAAPPGELGTRFLMAVRGRLGGAQPTARQKLLEMAHERAPADKAVLAALGQALMNDLKSRVQADPNADQEALRRQIIEITDQLGTTPGCIELQLLSELDALSGDYEQAATRLETCSNCAHPVACARARVLHAQHIESSEKRRAAEESFLLLACEDTPSCAESEEWIGQLAAARGADLSAYAHFARAAALEPTKQRWLSAARSAAKAQQLVRAEVAYHQARELGGKDPKTEELLAKARAGNLR